MVNNDIIYSCTQTSRVHIWFMSCLLRFQSNILAIRMGQLLGRIFLYIKLSRLSYMVYFVFDFCRVHFKTIYFFTQTTNHKSNIHFLLRQCSTHDSAKHNCVIILPSKTAINDLRFTNIYIYMFASISLVPFESFVLDLLFIYWNLYIQLTGFK